MKKKDILVEVYSATDYDLEGEYVVDYIVAERLEGKKGKKNPKMEYLVKWKASIPLFCQHKTLTSAQPNSQNQNGTSDTLLFACDVESRKKNAPVSCCFTHAVRNAC